MDKESWVHKPWEQNPISSWHQIKLLKGTDEPEMSYEEEEEEEEFTEWCKIPQSEPTYQSNSSKLSSSSFVHLKKTTLHKTKQNYNNNNKMRFLYIKKCNRYEYDVIIILQRRLGCEK